MKILACRACALLLLLALLAPSAHAQSGGDLPPIQRNSNGQWQISLRALGYGRTVQITGQNAERALFLPVPEGLMPHSLQTRLRISPEVTGGFLQVDVNDTAIATQNLAPTDTAIEIPLDKVRVRGDGFALVIRTHLRGADDACANALVGAWVELQDAVLLLTGNAQTPTTVGTFFPPILETLTIFTPAAPTSAEAEVAARLAAAATRRYAGQAMRISFQALADRNVLPVVSPASPFARVIVIREGADESASVQPVGDTAILVLSGARDALLQQSRLLASRFASRATSAAGPTQEIQTAQPMPTTRITFDALGWGSPRVTGVRQADKRLTFAQADLGGAVGALALQLTGTVTRDEDGQVALSILFNNILVREENLKRADAFDIYVPLPDLLLRRDNTLDVRFEFTPAVNNCRVDQPPFTGKISARSYIEFQRGRALTAGFGRLPQAFVPEFQIAFERLDANTLADATALVVALQRLTRTPLEFAVVDWASALKSDKPALLIAVGAVDVSSLNPPLLSEPTRLLAQDGKEQLRVEAGRSATVMQAFETNSRDALLLINQPNLEHAQNLANYIANDPLGWYGLQGDALIYDGETAPFDLRLRGGALRAEPLETALAVWWVRLQPFLYLAVLVLTLGALVWAYPRLVRRAPKV